MLDKTAPAATASTSSATLPDRIATNTSDVVLLLARVALALIFIKSGFGKITGLEPFAASLAARGVPMASALAVVGAAAEFFGGLAILLGVRIRLAALVMIAFVVVATLISHRFWELQEAAARAQEAQAGKNLAIIGGFLALFVTGGGRFSLDRLFGR